MLLLIKKLGVKELSQPLTESVSVSGMPRTGLAAEYFGAP